MKNIMLFGLMNGAAKDCQRCCLRNFRHLAFAGIASAGLAIAAPQAAHALAITPNFDSSITGSVNASAIEGAINSALGTVEGLYSDAVSLTVDFSYTPAGYGNLLSTTQYYYYYSYSAYTAALTADSVANPGNAALATALANLSSGNDANGLNDMVLAYGQTLLLSLYGLSTPESPPNAVININSLQPFDFTQPAANNAYDLTGGLEHELDEVLGGGGAGSMLNFQSFFPGTYGSLDLYRYSQGSNSFSTSSSVSSYLSIDGGANSIIAFNQNSNGDFGDFGPPCGTGGGTGQLIQNAFNCMGPAEAYTIASPEFTMLQAIGWNSTLTTAVPEPGTLGLFGFGLVGLVWMRRRSRATA